MTRNRERFSIGTFVCRRGRGSRGCHVECWGGVNGSVKQSRRRCASPLDRLGLGLCRWGGCDAGESRTVCRLPPPPFIWRSATGAHQLGRAGTPLIRAREGKALSDPLGLRGGFGDQPNSLPLDLTLCFSFLYFSRFFMDLYIEHASSSRSIADRFNSYNILLYSESNSIILWALLVQRS
jgi:hypothetical protein